MKKTKCCLCGKEIKECNGNDPWPLKDKGVCCTVCNWTRVIPARVALLDQQRRETVK